MALTDRRAWMNEPIRLEIHDGVAVVTLDTAGEKVNILNAALLGAMENIARDLVSRQELAAVVVISAKHGGFIAGADIHEIESVIDADAGAELARQGQRIFGLWAALPFPVVAALHGHCLGGGTEFALACHCRIATPDAVIALPEVRLGILPGFGGTQRLPRLISIEKALDIILTGRNVHAEEALALGLVDRLAPAGGLLDEAVVLAREAALDASHLRAARKRHQRSLRHWLLEKNPIGRALLFGEAHKRAVARAEGHYPGPPAIVEVVRRGLSMPIEQGLELEAKELGRLIVTEVSKNLVHLFFLSQRPKKGAPVTAEPTKVAKAAVLGAGVMGGGIAQLLAARAVPVLLKDIRSEAVTAGLAQAREMFGRQLAKKDGDAGKVAAKMTLITGTTSYDGFEGIDLVIEAVVEKMGVKQSVLRETETHMSAAAIFATNTSALSVSELQSVAQHPGRVGGMHFFNPVDRMPLVEIIRGERTDERTVATLFDTALRLGKTPVVVADRPGFLVNRLLVAYLNEACLAAGEGIEWQSLDRLAREFGLPMGPFRLIDEVGIDIAAEVGRTLCSAFPWLPESPLLAAAEASGLKGKKGGEGFYLYPADSKPQPNPAIGEKLKLPGKSQAGEADLRRLLLLMVNEAGRCLEEAVVAAPEDIDTGMVFGAGFPPFRGGLCRWADSEGLVKLVGELEELAGKHGERFAPCSWLKGRERFYAG
jgi:3-hydroxyacyl-CoA dehydrogenase/enoyl-CoA hydratase/3-hydroxybutyryl-CoA epimerase